MRGMVNGFVVGTLGLAVLFGSPGTSLARQKKPIIKKMGCQCLCQYTDSKGDAKYGSNVEWLDDGNDGKNCSYFGSRPWSCDVPGVGPVSGHLARCKTAAAPATKATGTGAVQGAQEGVIGPVVPSQPRVAPVKPPVGPLQKQP
jgi:hypothetical protein